MMAASQSQGFCRQMLSLQRRLCIRSLSFARKCHHDATQTLIAKEMLSENRVCRLILNQPKKRNALSLAMLRLLKSDLTAANSDVAVRAVILAATPPVFSAGHDLRELKSEENRSKHEELFATCSDVMKFIQEMHVPVIAEVGGLAAAAGCQLAASCDLIVASESATFSTPGAKAGLFCSTPGVAVARTLPRHLAMKMLLTAEPITAQDLGDQGLRLADELLCKYKENLKIQGAQLCSDAFRGGLVSELVSDSADLTAAAVATAEQICRLSRPVVALGKAFFYAQIQQDVNTAYRLGERVMVENLRLTDCQEGIDAFLNKRSPVWTHSSKRVF